MAPLPHIERVARAFINYTEATTDQKLPNPTKDPDKYLREMVKAKMVLKKELKVIGVSQMFDWGILVVSADPLKGIAGLAVLSEKPVETKAPVQTKLKFRSKPEPAANSIAGKKNAAKAEAKTQTPPKAATKPVLLISPKVQTKAESKKVAPVATAKTQTPAKLETKPAPVKAETQTLAKKQVFSKGLFGKSKPATSVARHA